VRRCHSGLSTGSAELVADSKSSDWTRDLLADSPRRVGSLASRMELIRSVVAVGFVVIALGGCGATTGVETSVSDGNARTVTVKNASPSVTVGEAVPDFRMARADGSGHVRISDSKGKRPIFLVFGSWT